MRKQERFPPSCFENAEHFEEWLAYARLCGRRPRSFCQDCTPAYHAQMVEIDRCDFPDVEFVELRAWDNERELIGIRR
mgnify:FL=1